MTCRVDSKAIEQVMEVLIDEDLDGRARALETLTNEAMKLEGWAMQPRMLRRTAPSLTAQW